MKHWELKAGLWREDWTGGKRHSVFTRVGKKTVEERARWRNEEHQTSVSDVSGGWEEGMWSGEWSGELGFSKNKIRNGEKKKSMVKSGSETHVSLQLQGTCRPPCPQGRTKQDRAENGVKRGKKKIQRRPEAERRAGMPRHKSGLSARQEKGWERKVWAWEKMIKEAQAEKERVAGGWKA